VRDIASGKGSYQFVDAERRENASKALALGIDCLLKTQIRQDGNLTAWCAQHDATTLERAWARAYEPPSVSGSESVGIVRFLMKIEEPSEEVIASVEGAVEWLAKVQMKG
jgi:PelA/Pel-15E family pectate lyase